MEEFGIGDTEKSTIDDDDVALMSKGKDCSSLEKAKKPSDFDLDCVRLNKDFCETSETCIGFQPDINFDAMKPNKVESTTDNELTLMQKISTMFSVQPTLPRDECHSVKNTTGVKDDPESIQRDEYPFENQSISMCSAIYCENASLKEDCISYLGYVIRTQGSDLCINSVMFNVTGQILRIVIKITDYDQFYCGKMERIESEPKIIVDKDKWTLIYGAYDDDDLGIVEIEVPPGSSVEDIHNRYCQGFIYIDVRNAGESNA